ncbi:hypothetical protein PFFVO_02199 [Plasmodium falciparum Vietnam Oak-Knoll (FVO)]|uniref:Uncharacterized protein n=1 Tax=Plasmodium falciparum Vietnam Oak-Knoll (FVO) TaxID=1036723 RepID=A0A024V8T8_PLAFA|nr:hypothetical protein PFFVO_02199 [Plasmodium falciparum Vietnam Oak-Knoll (FVO)]
MNSFIISTYLISKYIIFNMFKHILEIVKINPSTKYADYCYILYTLCIYRSVQVRYTSYIYIYIYIYTYIIFFFFFFFFFFFRFNEKKKKKIKRQMRIYIYIIMFI